jgi:hypothetical protein
MGPLDAETRETVGADCAETGAVLAAMSAMAVARKKAAMSFVFLRDLIEVRPGEAESFRLNCMAETPPCLHIDPTDRFLALGKTTGVPGRDQWLIYGFLVGPTVSIMGFEGSVVDHHFVSNWRYRIFSMLVVCLASMLLFVASGSG